MKVAARIGREYATQVAGFAVTLTDRLLIAGVLLRFWNVDDFAAWSVAVAAAGLVTVFDFGINLYSANRVLFLVEQGRHEEARVAQRAGNLLMLAASLTGLTVVLAGFTLFGQALGAVAMTPELWTTMALLALAGAVRAAIAVQASLYRAHEQYARQTLLLAALDAGRVAGTVAIVLLGGRLVAVGIGQLLITAAIAGFIVFVDSRRRFPAYRYGFAAMPRAERREAAGIALGYWVQSAPNTMLTYLPVFLLTGMGAAAVVVAQFVLMRTIGNFVRQVLQIFAIVLGQEAARRIARGDDDGLARVYRESGLLLTAQTACAAGVLLALGPQLFVLWTGEPGLYEPLLLWLAIGPPVLMPTMALSQTMLATANLPYTMAFGRIAQVVLTIAAFYLLPIGDVAARMLAALAIGELVGFGLPMVWTVRRIVRRAGLAFQIETAARSALSAALVYFAIVGGLRGLSLDGYGALGVGLVIGFAATVVAIGLVGTEPRRWRMLGERVRAGLR